MYVCIFLSGCMALTFQITWQKYLSFLVGSEARSISLVVAVFLLGLAAGYRFWGNLTEREFSRQAIIKIVGYIELTIAAYAIAFAPYFGFVKELSYAAPDWLVVDLAITVMLLFFPTFLMGASIPLLTAAIPDDVTEVNYCHSRVYGINTLGAFAGAFLGGFYLVPNFGLPTTLLIGAIINMALALVFIANRVGGPAHKAEEMPSIPNKFGSTGIYLFVFITGTVSIAYEVLFIRVLGLSIGSGHYTFPIVVGIVILGLAIGALSLRRGGVTANRVFFELIMLSGLLVILYFTVPLWGYWISHIRISLSTIPSNYGVFLFLVVLFVALLLLPIVIPMGRLLPIGYSLIDKTSRDYGKMCGRVYFINTIGTVCGAVGMGYAMFFLFDLETIFKINMALILLLIAFLYLRSGAKRPAIVFAALTVVVFALPGWDRQHHMVGLFRHYDVQPFHFENPFRPPPMPEVQRPLFFEDDPSVTVAVLEMPVGYGAAGEPVVSRTITVNGKSDGNTVADYSNMILTGLLPYLYATRETDLDAVVVGLGTGMTTGVLAAVEDVRAVTTAEISSGVIRALPYFDDHNFQLSTNPKSTIVKTDAFRYFARARNGYDIVISEPSNPWVVGVENLFTPEFYQLVSRVLNDDGVFFQWIQVYELSGPLFAAIVENVLQEFPYVSMYIIGTADVGLLASHQPLNDRNMERRLRDPAVQAALTPMALHDDGPLRLLEYYDHEQLETVALSNAYGTHRLDHPWLGHRAGRARFLGQMVVLHALLHREVARHIPVSEERRRAIDQWINDHYADWYIHCTNVTGHSVPFICSLLESMLRGRELLAQPVRAELVIEQIETYGRLRSRGLIDFNAAFLDDVKALVLGEHDAGGRARPLAPHERREIAAALVREHAYEWQWQQAREVAAELHQARIFAQPEYEQLLWQVSDIREIAQRVMALRDAASR